MITVLAQNQRMNTSENRNHYYCTSFRVKKKQRKWRRKKITRAYADARIFQFVVWSKYIHLVWYAQLKTQKRRREWWKNKVKCIFYARCRLIQKREGKAVRSSANIHDPLLSVVCVHKLYVNNEYTYEQQQYSTHYTKPTDPLLIQKMYITIKKYSPDSDTFSRM